MWRKPDEQNDKKTNRKTKDIQAEVTRGYAVALEVVHRALKQFPDDWSLTLARAASDTFAGIRPADAPGFVIVQLAGAAAATAIFRWLVPALPKVADRVVERLRDEELP